MSPQPSPVVSHSSAPEFQDALREQMRRAPWLVVSIAFHAVLLGVLGQFDWSVAPPERETRAMVATLDDTVVDPFEPPIPPEEPQRTVERPEDVEDVLFPDDVDVDVQESTEPSDLPPLAPAPFNGNGPNDVLGVGGGGGGPDGGGDRRRVGSKLKTPQNDVVDRGLDWLVRHQGPSGGWSAATFSDMCTTNRCDGEGDQVHDVGVTGLALLAFLGAGHTPTQGRYHDVVRRGMRYLVTSQDSETGCFGVPNSHQTFLYDHAIATLALTEGYGLGHQPMLREPAQRGIRFIHAARNPYEGWRYAYPANGESDLSVTGWMVMALESARFFGLVVDDAALDGARLVIDRLTDENSWRTGYISKGGYSAREPGMNEKWPESKTEAMTAVAMLCRVFLGEDDARSPALRGGADLLLKSLPTWDEKAGTIDYYYWYYGSYAMFQMAGSDWSKWQKRMLNAVVNTQRKDGDEIGSWDPQFDPWGHRGGRVYSTAIMTLCLEVYYRYDRVLGAR